MSIEVDPALRTLVTGGAGTLAVVVRDADDHGRAGQALRHARRSLAELPAGGGRVGVSAVVLTPHGPMVVLDGVARRSDAAARVVEAVRGALDAHGVVRATVTASRVDGLAQLDRCPGAVVLRLFPQPGAVPPLPDEWVELAGEWMLGELDGDRPVRLRVLGVELELPDAEAVGQLHHAVRARAWCDAVAGDLQRRIRTASVSFGLAPHLALGAGGPAVDPEGLLTRFELLVDVAREFAATAAYACVDVEPTFGGLAAGPGSTGRRERAASAHLVAGRLGDLAVPDLFPYQILGPGHAHRLREADPGLGDPPLGEALGDGRFEVRAGEAADWIPRDDAGEGARAAVRAAHRDLLASLLLTDEEARELLDELGPDDVDEPAAPEDDDPLDSADLSSIVLEPAPHGRRGTHLTVLELSAWLARAEHTDDPPSVSPVLAAFLRMLGQGLSDDQRQRLKPFAWRVLDTADGGARGHLGPVDRARARLACDWLVRVQGEAWLRAAGLTEAADGLLGLEPLGAGEQLRTAVDRLGSAAVVAGHRVDTGLGIASTATLGRAPRPSPRRPDPAETTLLEQLAWDAWERASEASAWVAAAEAARVGIPSELAAAADLRVIECARDRRVRDELDRRGDLGAPAWSAALDAAAALAWEEAWAAAERSVRDSSAFSLDTVIRRSIDAAAAELGVDAEQAAVLSGDAEREGRSVLARAARRGGAWEDGEHPWDAARRVARAASGGELWGRAIDSARAALGEVVYGDAMDRARGAVDELLQAAPDLVGRTVAVAVAREAAGAAGRGLALRAAGAARAHGADRAEAGTAADAALGGVVDALRESAFALLDEMLALEAAEPASPAPAPTPARGPGRGAGTRLRDALAETLRSAAPRR